MDWKRAALRQNFTDGQLVLAQDLNRVGGAAQTSLYNLISLICGPVDYSSGVPVESSGIPDGSFLEVTDSGLLDLSVAAGYGFIREPALDSPSGDDVLPGSFVPLVLDSATTLTMSNPGSYPRWDIVYAKASEIDWLSENRFVKTVGIAVTVVPTVRRFSATVGISEGTDGTTILNAPPGAEAYIELARVFHASLGVYVVQDSRPFLQLSQAVTGALPRSMVADHAATRWNTSATSLAVNPTSPPSLVLLANEGAVVINGQTVRSIAGALTVIVDPTNPRKSILYTTDEGVVGIEHGVAAAVPVEPAIPANTLALALIDVPAAATSIDLADITDRRNFDEWLDPDSLARPVDVEHVRSVYWVSGPGPDAATGAQDIISGQLVYADGSPYDPPPGFFTTIQATLLYEFQAAAPLTGGPNFTLMEHASYASSATMSAFGYPAGGFSMQIDAGQASLPFARLAADYRPGAVFGTDIYTRCNIIINDINTGQTPTLVHMPAFLLHIQVITQASGLVPSLAGPVCHHRYVRV